MDREKILQVLRNFLGNAVKFTFEGGEVRIFACRENGKTKVSVSVTGPGIPKENPQRAVKGHVTFNVPGVAGVPADVIISDRYLEFLVDELKPFIDANYRTLPGRDDTFIMGSSMGGLVSQYAMSQYPGVFGGAGCVSPHWPAGHGIVVDDFGAHLPDPARHRYYFDFGTGTLDEGYELYHRRADEWLRKAGYVEGQNWITLKFEGAEHSEKSWRLRVDRPLRSLLGK